MKKKVIIGLILAMLLVPVSCAPPPPMPAPAPAPAPMLAPAPAPAPPPASSPDYPNHGITTTKVEPKPGESVTTGSASWVRYTMDDLVEKSDTILIGKVVDIFPSRQVDKPPWIV